MRRRRHSARFVLPAPGRAILALVVAYALTVAAGSSSAATSGSVVGADVLSATAINATGCARDTPNVTSFGTLTSGSSAVTSLDCVVTFGSSNDSARLRIAQTDGVGDAMFQELGARGAFDGGFAAGAGMLASAGLSVSAASASNSSGGIARQSDGRFLVAGENGATIEVRRYLPDGTLDGGFGPVSVAPCAAQQDVAGIVVGSGDDFWIGGDADSCPAVGVWAMHFSADGVQDMTYGGDGLGEFGVVEEIRDLDAFADGAVVLGGGGSTHEVFRLTPGGVPDTGFSGDGRATLGAIGGGGAVRGVAALSDGSAVASGYMNPGGGDEAYVARLLSTGAFHGTFGGGDGWERTNHPATIEGRSLSVARDGSIFVAAYTGIVKFTSGGLTDGTFGTNGVLDLSGSNPLLQLHDVVAQDDLRPVAVGQYNGAQVAIVRATAGGILDSKFGSGGVQTHDPSGLNNGANRATWSEDGDLLTFGTGGAGASVVRLNGSSITDYDNGAANWTTPGTNAFGACLATVAAGATAMWTTDGTCGAANGLDWNEVTPAASPVARTTVVGTQGATANLRFGLRTLASQADGTYIAPITFSVVAPDA